MAEISDGAIVGSAIIKLLEKYGKDAPKYIGEYVKAMKDSVSILVWTGKAEQTILPSVD